MDGYEIMDGPGDVVIRIDGDDDFRVAFYPRACCLMRGWVPVCFVGEKNRRTLARFRARFPVAPNATPRKPPERAKTRAESYLDAEDEDGARFATNDPGLVFLGYLLRKGYERDKANTMLSLYPEDALPRKIEALREELREAGEDEEREYQEYLQSLQTDLNFT